MFQMCELPFVQGLRATVGKFPRATNMQNVQMCGARPGRISQKFKAMMCERSVPRGNGKICLFWDTLARIITLSGKKKLF